MKLIKYKHEFYYAQDPKHIGAGRYTCTARNCRTSRVTTNERALNTLALKYIIARRAERNEKDGR